MRNKLSVPDHALLYIGYRGLDGFTIFIEDDIYTFFDHTISDARARNILHELYSKHYLHRKKKEKEKDMATKKTRRGPRGFLYSLTIRGIQRFNYLIEKGYTLGETWSMRQWVDEDIDRYYSFLKISRRNPWRRNPWL